MFDWLFQYDEQVTVLTDIGTLLIWLIYAQLLYFSFRRQRRPRLIINRGKKKDINALCLISNMSAEPIFIQHIIAELKTSEGVISMDVTDRKESYEDSPDEDRRGAHGSSGKPSLSEGTHQGPLQPGSFVHIDSFSDLIRCLAREEGIEVEGIHPKGDVTFHSLTIRLICIYGSEDHPIGAERTFTIDVEQDPCALVPETWDTRRLASRWQRRKLRRQVETLNAVNDL